MKTAEQKKTFLEMIQSDKPVLIDFSAEWCGPCQIMKPILNDLKNRMLDKAEIYTLDVDENPTVASNYNIQGVPTLMIFINGAVKWRQAGVMQASHLEHLINQFI